MTQAEFLTAHAVHGQTRGARVADTCALFRAHGVERRARRRRSRHAAIAIARGVPELPRASGACSPATRCASAARAWRVIAGYGHSPEHAALHSARRARADLAATCCCRASAPTSSVWPAEPDGDPLGALPRLARAFEALPDDTLVLPSHGLPFRGIAAARRAACARIMPRGSPSCSTLSPPRDAACPRRRSCRCCSAASSTRSSASSPSARRSPTSTTCGTRGTLARAIATHDGASRFGQSDDRSSTYTTKARMATAHATPAANAAAGHADATTRSRSPNRSPRPRRRARS